MAWYRQVQMVSPLYRFKVMITTLKRLFFTLIVLVCTSCTPDEHQQKITFLAIVDAEKRFMETFQQGDSAGIAALYSPDGQLFPANNEVVTGQQAIDDFWRGLMDLGITAVKLKTLEVEGKDNTVHEVGQYTIHTSDGQIVDFGKYIVIWKKHQETWQLYRHIWTTSMTREQGLKI